MTDNRLLDALSCRGVLVNVSVRYWRARKKLNPEDQGLPSCLRRPPTRVGGAVPGAF